MHVIVILIDCEERGDIVQRIHGVLTFPSLGYLVTGVRLTAAEGRPPAPLSWHVTDTSTGIPASDR